jgi:hypothetical protein
MVIGEKLNDVDVTPAMALRYLTMNRFLTMAHRARAAGKEKSALAFARCAARLERELMAEIAEKGLAHG